MYEINFGKPEHVHFIGIGGISMSGLAEVLLDAGFHVSGSDNKESELTKRLSEKGADITIEVLDDVQVPWTVDGEYLENSSVFHIIDHQQAVSLLVPHSFVGTAFFQEPEE